MKLLRSISISCLALSIPSAAAGVICDVCQGEGPPTQPHEVIEDAVLGSHTCDFIYQSGLQEGFSEAQCLSLIDASLAVCACGESAVESPYDPETGECHVCLEGRKPRRPDADVPPLGMTCGELYLVALNGEFSHQKEHCFVAAAYASEECDCRQDAAYQRRSLGASTQEDETRRYRYLRSSGD